MSDEKPNDGSSSAPGKSAGGRSSVSSTNLFQIVDQYPDAKALISHVHAPIGEVVENGMVALDASVLLYAYEFKSESLAAVGELYANLAKQGRLLIPAHAVREFYINRTKTLARVSETIGNYIRKPVQNPFTERLGLLEDNADYKSAKEIAGKIAHLGRQLIERLRGLESHLESNLGNDPVTTLYRAIFENAIADIDMDAESRAALESEWKDRKRLGIAPGLTDVDKERNSIGDLLFWKTVLAEGHRRTGHCIIVLEETKLDWWGGSKNNPFQPRPELVDEYRIASGGGSLFLMSLSTALKHFDQYVVPAKSTASADGAVEVKKVSLAKVARNIDNHQQSRSLQTENPPQRRQRLLAESEVARLSAYIDNLQSELNAATSNDEFIRLVNRLTPLIEARQRATATLARLIDERENKEIVITD